MANPEHLKILKQGVEVWNRWREQDAETRPDLTDADLESASLVKANFRQANLSNANLRRTNFKDATFTGSILKGADFTRAWLYDANFIDADLRGVRLPFTLIFFTRKWG